MKSADVSSLNEQCVFGLIIGAVSAERFYEGVLLDFFNSGYIFNWLEPLKKIDKGGVSNGK